MKTEPASLRLDADAKQAGGSNAYMWFRFQAAYDLAEARKHDDKTHVERLEAV